MQKFKNGSLAVTSLSNQVLVIPEKHYPHWFTIPLEAQVKLFQNMLALRKAHSSEIKGPIEFHCGAAGARQYFIFMEELAFILFEMLKAFIAISFENPYDNRFLRRDACIS